MAKRLALIIFALMLGWRAVPGAEAPGAAAPAPVGGPPPRATLNMDSGWRFHLGESTGAQVAEFDDAAWRTLDVPHDWSAEGDYAPANPPQNAWLPAGVGWYRKSFDADPAWAGRKLLLRFDGVYMNSQVWLNGQPVGGRPYGFISFDCDLTTRVLAGKNVIAVRVDNSPAPTARFYHGSGIYGHVNLLLLPRVHVAPLGGVFVRTREAGAGLALLAVTTEVRNESAAPALARVRQILRDDKDAEVTATDGMALRVAPGETGRVAQNIEVRNPRLWSPDQPSLYRLETRVELDGTLADDVVTACGIRTARFDARTGFWLNGRNIKLKGVCEHENLSPVGLAAPDALTEWRLRQLKAMGCNAIRTAHNPFTPAFYRLCDELGLLVMDEAFDGWRRKGASDYGGRFFAQWWRRDVEDFIRRDRNHPSVVLWSIGNETGGTDEHGISQWIARWDETRPTTGGSVLSGVGVSGFNGPGETPGRLDAFHRQNPQQPIVLTEVPHTLETRGVYHVLTWWRDAGNPRFPFPPYGTSEIFTEGAANYFSSYDNALVRMSARDSWRRTSTTPWISGEFRWTGFDTLGEAQFMGAAYPKRCYSSGVIDLAGFPKDGFYFYQSQWTEAPMVHLLPHWTHPRLAAGTAVPVVAYSNCEEVELFLNGKSLGRQRPRDLLDFVWQVPWQPGELKALGYRQGRAVAETVLRTAGGAEQLKLQASGADERTGVEAGELKLLTVSALDAAGEFVPDAGNRVAFLVTGPARVLGFENGDPVDGTPNRATARRLFHGLARGYIMLPPGAAPASVAAAAILGERTFADTTRVAICATEAALRGPALPRGPAPAAGFSIHFTTDGSTPTLQSPLYRAPFTIDASTRVRGLVVRGGQPVLALAEDFTRGRLPALVDPRFEKPAGPAVKPGPFNGPFDARLVGAWQEGSLRFIFRPDGTLIRVNGQAETPVAWWWYEFPNDPFEAGAAGENGRGELRWMNRGDVSRLEATGPRAEGLTITTGARTRHFTRAK